MKCVLKLVICFCFSLSAISQCFADVLIQSEKMKNQDYKNFLASHPEYLDFVQSYIYANQDVPEDVLELSSKAHHLYLDHKPSQAFETYLQVHSRLQNAPILKRQRKLFLKVLARLYELAPDSDSQAHWLEELQLNFLLSPEESAETVKDLSKSAANLQFFKNHPLKTWTPNESFEPYSKLFINGIELNLEAALNVKLSPLHNYQFVLLSNRRLPLVIEGSLTEFLQKAETTSPMLEGDCLNPKSHFPLLVQTKFLGYYGDSCLVNLNRAILETQAAPHLETLTATQTEPSHWSSSWLVPVVAVLAASITVYSMQGKRVVFER